MNSFNLTPVANVEIEHFIFRIVPRHLGHEKMDTIANLMGLKFLQKTPYAVLYSRLKAITIVLQHIAQRGGGFWPVRMNCDDFKDLLFYEVDQPPRNEDTKS